MDIQGNLPSALDLPTGLGKTSVMAIWYLAQRAVVDQATAVADEIKEQSCDSALRIRTLRGQYADNRQWLEDRLAEAAWALSDEGKASAQVLVYCNSRDVAEKTKKAIEKNLKEYNKNKMESAQIPSGNVQLFVGARRVKERQDAKNKLEELGFFSGNDAPDRAAFVIATSADEVGVDLDADHMVMDLVPFERMVQRLGRVNRLGGEDREAHIVVIEEADKALSDDLKECAKKAALLLRGFLPPAAFQAGPGAFIQLTEALKKQWCEQRIRDASSPDPLYPALTRPLVDAWSMTSLKEHTGRSEIADFFAAAPPHLTEILEVPTYKVHEWLFKRAEKLAEAVGKAGAKAVSDGAEDADADYRASLNEQKIVAIGLGRSGEDAELFTLSGLVEAAKLVKDVKSKTSKETH